VSLVSRLLDATIVLSFDRTGYRRHAASFRPEDLDVDLSGRTAVVTGANSGIGRATARSLAARGADVVLLCRSAERGRPALDALRQETGSRRLRLVTVDVAETASLRRAVEAIPARQVHVLVNNAAVLPDEREETSEGLERTFATNVLGPHRLTRLLEPRLRAAGEARVVNVSSGGMYARRLSLEDWDWRRRPFDGVSAYADAKRALVVLTELWAERLRATGVTVNAMHPGWADTPAVRTSLPRFRRAMAARLRTPEEGADTVVWMCVCPRLFRETGRFYFDREPRTTHLLPWTRESGEDRRRLWHLCESFSNIRKATIRARRKHSE
jgi:NAD(P)-dependent dehydrogenase (short-subunit alcohol dehydrogenase family)